MGRLHDLAPVDDDAHAQTPLSYVGKRGNLNLDPPVHFFTRQFYKTMAGVGGSSATAPGALAGP